MLTITGMAAGFTVLFGAPLGAALFALEILHRRGLEYYEALMPALGRVAVRLRRVRRRHARRARADLGTSPRRCRCDAADLALGRRPPAWRAPWWRRVRLPGPACRAVGRPSRRARPALGGLALGGCSRCSRRTP